MAASASPGPEVAPAPKPGLLARSLGRLTAWTTASRLRSAMVVLLGLLLGAASTLFGLFGMAIDTDLRALLPETAPSVIALDDLEARKGSSERFVVAIEAPTSADAEIMAEAVAYEISTWPETEELTVVRDYTPLRNHALYLMEFEQLEELRDELEAEHKRAVARAVGPGLTDDPVDVEAISAGDDWDDWDDGGKLDWGTPKGKAGTKVDGTSDTKPDTAEPEPARDLDALLADQRDGLVETSGLTPEEVELIWPEENARGEIEWREQVGKPYVDSSGTVRTIQASLSVPATDIEFAQDVVARVAERAHDMRDSEVDPDTRVEVVAAYDVSREVDVILRDAKRATWISAGLVLGVLLLGFRNPRALLLIAVPMLVAMGMTLATTKLTFGVLNALTVFLFAVLFGMGVDFSVHLYALRERQGRDADWGMVIREHLRPLSATMLTTSGSLAVLSLAEFKAFREFGVISAIGVAICFLAAVVLVPTLDNLLGPLRWRWSRPPPVERVAAERAVSSGRAPLAPRLARSFATVRYLVLAGLAIVAVVGAPRLEIERDTRALRAKSQHGEPQIDYGSTSEGRCAKTLALVAEGPQQLNRAVERMQAEQGRLLPDAIDTGEARLPWVREVFSLRTVMPEQQARKAELVDGVRQRANAFLAELPDLDDDAKRYRTHLEALERMAQADALTVEELPRWSVEPFRERDGRSDRIAHVCLDIAGYHIDELVAVRHRLDDLLAGLEVRAADSRLVFADLMVLVELDARRLPLVALAVILLFIALDLRRLGPTLACFATLGLGLALGLAVMGLWPLRLNFFNLVVMPSVVGLGIDASIHLWHARERADLAATGKASLIAAMTTVAGFSGLLSAHHSGLRSIGEVGVVAIVLCVGVAFLALYPVRRARP